MTPRALPTGLPPSSSVANVDIPMARSPKGMRLPTPFPSDARRCSGYNPRLPIACRAASASGATTSPASSPPRLFTAS
jgi:hypothetical protein